jgi:branched-chain amino acid transport system ATP-binding protein
VSAPFFAVSNLSLSFGGVKAVSDVSFSVEKRQIFAIIGPNGAGKTSVFNLITRVFDPSAGHVLIEGRDIVRVPRHEIVRHGIARTFQNIELFDGATVLENLMLGCHRSWTGSFWAEILNLPSVRRAEHLARENVEDIIALLGLAPHRHSMVAGLPYGIRKNVELGRALATRPQLLLLDEPASGLNPDETRELSHWLTDIREKLGITIVMVEHDMSLVTAVADRVLVMEQGRVLTSGSAAEVQADARVVAAYLGT